VTETSRPAVEEEGARSRLQAEQRERNPTSDSAVPTTCASGEMEMVFDSEIERREPMLGSNFVSGEPPTSAPGNYGTAGPKGFPCSFRPQRGQSSIQAPATPTPTAMPRGRTARLCQFRQKLRRLARPQWPPFPGCSPSLHRSAARRRSRRRLYQPPSCSARRAWWLALHPARRAPLLQRYKQDQPHSPRRAPSFPVKRQTAQTRIHDLPSGNAAIAWRPVVNPLIATANVRRHLRRLTSSSRS